jgi:hypothetical protein
MANKTFFLLICMVQIQLRAYHSIFARFLFLFFFRFFFSKKKLGRFTTGCSEHPYNCYLLYLDERRASF